MAILGDGSFSTAFSPAFGGVEPPPVPSPTQPDPPGPANPGLGVGDPAPENSYNIDQRTGFKVLPGSLITDWTGTKTLREHADPREFQFRVRVTAELLEGSIRPEPEDNFIDSISDGDTL